MGVLDPKHFHGDEAATAELEQGIHEEFAAAMQRAGERKTRAAAAEAAGSSADEEAAATAQATVLKTVCTEAEGWGDMLGGSGSLFTKTAKAAAANSPQAEYGGRARVHIEGRLLLLPACESGSLFFSTESGTNADEVSRSNSDFVAFATGAASS